MSTSGLLGGRVEVPKMSVADVASTVTELTVDQARKLFDDRCREELGVSGAEFIKRLHARDIPAEWSAEAVSRLEFLLPLAR
jgi:hypothetical protein